MTLQLSQGSFCSIPVGWTDLLPPDPYQSLGGGRSLFRVEDLLALADLINLKGGRR